MWSYIWPILIVVSANTIYHICAKSTPENVQAFASLTVTYMVAAVMSFIMFYFTSENKNIFSEIRNVNWTSLALGFSIIGLEAGYMQVYRAGWNISAGSLVANISLALVLILVGIILYREHISLNQIIGIVLCILGILFINKN